MLRVYSRAAWWGLVAPHLHEREPLFVAQAVILRGEGEAAEVLLSLRSDVCGWELPGGQPEAGESCESTVLREVLEETGVTVVIERRVGDYIRRGFRPHTARVYLCRVVTGEIRPSRETPDVRWFPVYDTPATLFPWYHQPFGDALIGFDEPVVRHDRLGLRAILAGIRIDLKMRLWGGGRS